MDTVLYREKGKITKWLCLCFCTIVKCAHLNCVFLPRCNALQLFIYFMFITVHMIFAHFYKLKDQSKSFSVVTDNMPPIATCNIPSIPFELEIIPQAPFPHSICIEFVYISIRLKRHHACMCSEA